MRYIGILILFLLFGCQPKISEQSDIYTYPEGNPLDSVEVIPADTIIVKRDNIGMFQDIVKGYPWKYLVIHCTFSQVKAKPAPISVFTNYWKNTLGWDKPGYLAIVRTNGDVAFLTKNNFDRYITEEEVTYGVKGMNRFSIHVAIEGMAVYENGKLVNADTRTAKQRESLDMIVAAAREIKPDIIVVGHRDIQKYTNKSCPNFDVLDEYGTYSRADLIEDSLHYIIIDRVNLLN